MQLSEMDKYISEQLEQAELNKLDLSNFIIEIFNTYKHIDNIIFTVGDSISFVNNDGKKKRIFKESINLKSIGFVSTNIMPDYSHFSSLLDNYYINKSSNLLNPSDNYNNQCLFHLLFINDYSKFLLHSHIVETHNSNNYFNNLFPIASDDINTKDSLHNKILIDYLDKYDLKFILTSDYLDNILSLIIEKQKKLLNLYPINFFTKKLNVTTYRHQTIAFYRNTLSENIKDFYGLDMLCKQRSIELCKKLTTHHKRRELRKI